MKQTENLSLRVSVLEIYNEQLTDLLRESSSTEHVTGTSSFATATSTSKLTIVETAAGIQVPSLFVVPVVSEDDAYSGFFSLLMKNDHLRVLYILFKLFNSLCSVLRGIKQSCNGRA